ncbi:hypothetical protein OAG68_00660 [bacterium]|nr:hypothetical protein [bacterium]
MKSYVFLLVGLGTLLALSVQSGAPNRQSNAGNAASATDVVAFEQVDERSSKDALDWKQDPVCQMVFFAVLEGLYSDGVADDVVESVIGPKCDLDDAELMQERIGRSFVLKCPLCQPTFEAFVAYQNRPRFSDGTGASHFGEGLEDELREGLLSENSQNRLQALKVPVQKWVSKKLKSSSLSKEQIAEWAQRIEKRGGEGKSQLMTLMESDDRYKDWSPYWGCAACNGSTDAAREWAAGR